MAILDINPRYRDFLARHGLDDVDRLQSLPATVVCGHPNRHVLTGTLGPETENLPIYIKRQHRLGWGERLGNAWAGFGWVSLARREARMLEHLHGAGVAAPEWIAAGEDDQGGAFLILKAIPECRDLPDFLRGPVGQRATPRRRLAGLLGQALAHVHDAGFAHGDLYAKHVLVHATGTAIHFLDWQRARRHAEIDWPSRWRDLAALDATLANVLANPRDRLACLHAYLRAALPIRQPREFRRRAVLAILQHSRQLQQLRRIREQRQTSVTIGSQPLIWLDGERLCVTPEFREVFDGQVPDWLLAPAEEDPPFAVPGSAKAMLIRRSSDEMVRWLWSRLRRRHMTSPEVRQAGLLFRLQRYGVPTPRLLAFGQRHPLPWRTESFLLTDVPRSLALAEWLKERPRWTAERKERWRVLRAAGDLVRRIHDASCLGLGTVALLGVRGADHDVVLEDIASLSIDRRGSERKRVADLRGLFHSVPAGVCNRPELLRCLLAYRGQRRVTAETRQWLHAIRRGQEARRAA